MFCWLLLSHTSLDPFHKHFPGKIIFHFILFYSVLSFSVKEFKELSPDRPGNKNFTENVGHHWSSNLIRFPVFNRVLRKPSGCKNGNKIKTHFIAVRPVDLYVWELHPCCQSLTVLSSTPLNWILQSTLTGLVSTKSCSIISSTTRTTSRTRSNLPLLQLR